MKKLSFKKIGLIIKNNYIINRSIPVILFAVVLALGCIIGAMPISDIEARYEYRKTMNIEGYESYVSSMTNTYGDLVGADSVFSIVYIVAGLILAFLSVLSLNGFMRDKSGNDFYHSLFVNRGEIFVANYITAFVNTAVTIVASQLGGLLLMNFIADYKPMSLGELIATQTPIILTILLFTALFTALAMLATIASGSVPAGIVNYACLNFYIPATILAVAVAGSRFGSNLMDWLEHYPAPFAYTSPFIRYCFACVGNYEMTALSYLLTALATVALIAFGIWVYSVKKNENASKPLPFSKTVRPLQYLLIFDLILLGSTFFKAITSSYIWFIIGGLLALFFGFIIFNAFAEKSFNGVFRGAKHMVFILILSVVAGLIFVVDCFGIYKEPMPNYDEITNAYLYVSATYDDREESQNYSFDAYDEDDYRYGTQIDDENKKLLSEIYQLLSEYKENGYVRTEGEANINVSMSIRCKNDFSRYHIYAHFTEASAGWAKVSALLDELAEQYPPNDEYVYYFEETKEY